MAGIEYEKLRSAARELLTSEQSEVVDAAIKFAEDKLSAHHRYDNSPMLNHGCAVALIVLREIELDHHAAAAAVIHDVVRIAHKELNKTEFTPLIKEIETLFGKDVVGIAMGLCNISEIRLKVAKDQAATYREMIVAHSEDPRVILIKLADRLEVMRSLDLFPVEKRRKKSWESINLYAQIAHKLGLYGIKSELEDLALKYIEPEAYQHITQKLAESEKERQEFIEKFVEPIKTELDEINLKYHIKSRTKSVFSIWTKMRKQGCDFEGVYDIFAIRIILDCAPEREKRQCWTVYSIVGDLYTPNPKRMRDWITIPKSNGYESLHTTVSAKGGRWVEIQIRTERMDEVAERGIAAHWRYKGLSNAVQTTEVWLDRLREVMEDTPQALPEKFDQMPTSHEIFVFTPNGDVRKLPEGARLLDFAFDIHTRLGSTCSGGKVNNRAVSIREQLKNGDIVEVFTQKNQTPKADWLGIVTTSKARNRIKIFLREEQARNAKIGREELERKVKNWKFTRPIDEVVAYLTKHFKVRTGTEVYRMIVEQKVDMGSIKEILTRWTSGAEEQERRAAAAEIERQKNEKKNNAASQDKSKSSSDALVIDDTIDKLEYKLAKCCNPIKGDAVFGFVTISTGITIHRKDCPNAKRMYERYPYRCMEAKWRANTEGAFHASIHITADDIAGLANRITEVVSHELKLNIRSIQFASQRDKAVGKINIEVPSASVVDTLIHSILKIKGIRNVYRES